MKSWKRILLLVFLFMLTTMTVYAKVHVSFRYGNGFTLVMSIICALISGIAMVSSISNREEISARTIGTFSMSILCIILIVTNG